MSGDGRDLGGPPREIAIDPSGGKPALTICPACGWENIQGTDYCVNCNSDLRTLDIPPETPIPGEGPPGESVRDLAHREPATVTRDVSVRDAIGLLRDLSQGCAVVLEGRRVIGIFTERDVLYKVSGDRTHLLEMTVGDVMTPNPIVMRDSESVLVALNEMGTGGFRHLPLVDAEGNLKGMLYGRDLLQYVAQRAGLG